MKGIICYHKAIPNLRPKELLYALEKIVTSPYFEEYEVQNSIIIDSKKFIMELGGRMRGDSRGYSYPAVKDLARMIVGAFESINKRDRTAWAELHIYPSNKMLRGLGIKQLDINSLNKNIHFPLYIYNARPVIIGALPRRMSLEFSSQESRYLGLDGDRSKSQILALKKLHRQWDYHLGNLFPGRIKDYKNLKKK